MDGKRRSQLSWEERHYTCEARRAKARLEGFAPGSAQAKEWLAYLESCEHEVRVARSQRQRESRGR